MNENLLEVDVYAHVLGSMDHCNHCQVFLDGVGVGGQIHQEDLESWPKDWMEDWRKLSDLIYQITEHNAGKLVVRITDAQSPQGMWAAIRKRVRKYPTFIVGGERYTGLDPEAVSSLVSRHLAARSN
jgi:hypothetical protein